MDPVSHFKFACPVCGQHLEARVGEAGQTTECPSCFKKLTVPQAPTQGGGKLIITAALADTRRVPTQTSVESAPQPLQRISSRAPVTFLMVAIVVAVLAGSGFLFLKFSGLNFGSDDESGGPELWTDVAAELTLLDQPVVGRLNGWDFSATTAFWRDTRLVLRQDGGQPEALRLQITFPLRGGELVRGKAVRIGHDDAPFETPVRIIWKDESGRDQYKPVTSGYVLWVEFAEVSPTTVSGWIHICLPDTARSWVAGKFSAENKTRIR